MRKVKVYILALVDPGSAHPLDDAYLFTSEEERDRWADQNKVPKIVYDYLVQEIDI